jgi:hypothetical protein
MRSEGMPIIPGNEIVGLFEHDGFSQLLAASEADVPSAAVLALAECCPLLEEVGVRGVEIGDEEITALVRGCPVLRRLQITGTSVTLEGLRVIREHCKTLKEIELDSDMFPGEDYAFFPPDVEVGINAI